MTIEQSPVTIGTQKYVVNYRDGSGYAVFDLGVDNVISPTFESESCADAWLAGLVFGLEQVSEAV